MFLFNPEVKTAGCLAKYFLTYKGMILCVCLSSRVGTIGLVVICGYIAFPCNFICFISL